MMANVSQGKAITFDRVSSLLELKCQKCKLKVL
jgi:hypothetical protein